MSARLRFQAIALCLAGLALFGGKARADELTIGVDLYSHHIPARSYQNNANLGIYVRSESGLGGGIYRNTLRRNSLWLGQQVKLGRVDVMLGAVSGYQKKCTDTVTEVATPAPVMVFRAGGPALGTQHEPAPHMTTVHTEHECHGFSRGWATPMVAPSIALPRMYGTTPRLWFVATPHRAVIHLSTEY